MSESSDREMARLRDSGKNPPEEQGEKEIPKVLLGSDLFIRVHGKTSAYDIPIAPNANYSIAGFYQDGDGVLGADFARGPDESVVHLKFLRPDSHLVSPSWWLTRILPARARRAYCRKFGHPDRCLTREVTEMARPLNASFSGPEYTIEFEGLSETVVRDTSCALCGTVVFHSTGYEAPEEE